VEKFTSAVPQGCIVESLLVLVAWGNMATNLAVVAAQGGHAEIVLRNWQLRIRVICEASCLTHVGGTPNL
jgi:hypothetical protein